MDLPERRADDVKTTTTLPEHVPVLIYHSVSDAPPTEIAKYSVSPAQFEDHLALIKASGRTACGFGELAAKLVAGASVDNLVCVTFDDGWADHLDAAQSLATAELPATIFITSGLLNQRSMLTDSELRELHAVPGIEIGAHSVSHPHLDELSNEQAGREVSESKATIEGLIGGRIEAFAYPHGAYSKDVREAVIDAGFTSAAAVKNAFTHADDDPFAIARWMVFRNTTPSQLGAILDGTGAPRAWRGERLRTRTSRRVRRLRRRLNG